MQTIQTIKPRPRDFIQTKENLIFAVVSYVHEEDKILSFLRYVPVNEGFEKFKKVNTKEAREILKNKFPKYLFYSKKFDANLHGVSAGDIKKILYPQERLQEILNSDKNKIYEIEEKILKLVGIFNENKISFDKMGVTGSVLIKNQNKNSDIDLVIYGIENFEKARTLAKELTAKGEIFELDDKLWKDTYERRNPAVSFDEFLWHEKRKFNKGSIDNTKFDILLVRDFHEIMPDEKIYKKEGRIKLRAEVIDDKFAYDYPARYKIKVDKIYKNKIENNNYKLKIENNNNEISEVVSFTHTYCGQAKFGEIIEVSGILEEYDGWKRIVVGTTREAAGEYVKVVG